IWARAAVRDLEDEHASGRGGEKLTKRLVAHSIRFGVLSRFTAFVAIYPERTVEGPMDEVVQPVEAPSGWATAAGFAPAPMMAAGLGTHAAPPSGAMPAAAMPVGAMPAARQVDMLRRMPPRAESGPPAPRSLKHLLKQVQKATQVRRSGLDRVLEELKAHRDATTEPDLRAALVQLCNALTRFLKDSKAHAREVLVAVDAVKRALGDGDRGRRVSKLRFWE